MEKNFNANLVTIENAISEIIDNEVLVLNVLNGTHAECEKVFTLSKFVREILKN